MTSARVAMLRPSGSDNNSTNNLTNKQKQSYNIKDELIILYSMYIY